MTLTPSDIENTVANSFGRNIAEPQFALLGNFATKAIRVEGSDQDGLVWVHGLGDDKTSSFTAFKAIEFRNLFGRPVEVVLTKLGYKIVGLAPEDATFSANAETSSQFPVVREQLMFAGIVPTEPASGKVQLMHGLVRVNDQHYYVNDVQSGNLIDGSTNDTGASAISLPSTDGQAKIVMVQVDPTTETVSYKQTAAFNASFALSQVTLPTPDSGNFLWGYVKLIKGIAALTFDNIINTPDILTLSNASGSGGTLDLDVTQGETVALTENVYLNPSDNEWYKIDTDASPIAIGSKRGVVVNIDNAPTITVRTQGLVEGYSSLTPGNPVYASTTAGGYTQTRPNITDGGGQVAICEMGVAMSATTVYVDPQPIEYSKRETLADNATLTITHHSDAQTRRRKWQAYVASTGAGSTVTSYATGNYDTDIYLEGLTLAGDSITWSASGSTANLGDDSGNEIDLAQSFTTVNGGRFTQFTVDFSSNVGTPSGDCTWTLEGNSGGSPDGSPLDTGTFTPTPSATNTINISNGVILDPATVYWIVLDVPDQATNNRYRVVNQSTSAYAGGEFKFRVNGGAWQDPGNFDLDMTITVSAITEKDKLAQGFQVAGNETLGIVQLYLKKIGTPTGTLTLRIETDNSGDPSGTLVHANATVNVSESSLSTSYGLIDFEFASTFDISASTQYHIVLSTDRAQSDTNYIAWAIDTSTPSYSNGEFKSELTSTWSSESADGVFYVTAIGSQFDEALSTGSVTLDNAEIGVRLDDGSGSDGDTNTTFKNQTGASADVVCQVIL